MAGRNVEEDVRAVLAADQVDVIDAQIGGDLVVARWSPWALPFDAIGYAPAQAVGRFEEALAVFPRLGEFFGRLPCC